MHTVFIGTSGWNYDSWKGPFYPESLPKNKWLEYYAGIFQTVEVNATFYHEMNKTTYIKWRELTPDGFCWAIKAHHYITHIKRLHDVEEPLKRFLLSISFLGEKLGPILFQLPPSLVFDRTLVEKFNADVHHAGLPESVRFVLEPRHPSWIEDEVIDCLCKLDLGFCISDAGGRYPFCEAVTSDFAYIRLHGPEALYASSYSDAQLIDWAKRITALDTDAYVYFNNDFMGYAPNNARTLIKFMHDIDHKANS